MTPTADSGRIEEKQLPIAGAIEHCLPIAYW